jgi:propanol-preferring alcohol dehydrogenase
VANLTRQDAHRLLEIAPRVPVHTQVQVFPLEHTSDALDALRAGQIQGAAVVSID